MSPLLIVFFVLILNSQESMILIDYPISKVKGRYLVDNGLDAIGLTPRASHFPRRELRFEAF